MLKSNYKNASPQIINYRDFKKFSIDDFRSDLALALSRTQIADFLSFNDALEEVLNSHAPRNSRVIRGNHKPHLTKAMRKAIMKRSYYKNKGNKTGDAHFVSLYKRQGNFIVNMKRSAKQSYFRSIGTSSKDFWSLCKPFTAREKIALLDSENGDLITNDNQVSSIYNEFFVNITSSLDIKPWETNSDLSQQSGSESVDDIGSIMRKFEDHPSVIAIRTICNGKSCNISHVEPHEVYRVICNLNARKAVSGEIPTKIIQMAADLVCIPLTDCINASLLNVVFTHVLKLADVSPVYKKGEKFLKENYRPISVLPPLSKIYEKVLYDQISTTLITSFRHTSADSVANTAPSILSFA